VISELFYDFARAGPVGWKVIGKLPGPVFNPSPPLPSGFSDNNYAGKNYRPSIAETSID